MPIYVREVVCLEGVVTYVPDSVNTPSTQSGLSTRSGTMKEKFTGVGPIAFN